MNSCFNELLASLTKEDPSEIAGAVLYLANGACGYTTENPCPGTVM